ELEPKFVQFRMKLSKQLKLKTEMRKIVMQVKYLKGFLVEGRLVKLHRPGAANWWGLAIDCKDFVKISNQKDPSENWSVVVVAPCKKDSKLDGRGDTLMTRVKFDDVSAGDDDTEMKYFQVS